jgi:FXSXX-COOH protein
MTPSAPDVETGLLRAADLPLDELLALHRGGDAALDHCLRRVLESSTSGGHERVAAFNAAPPRPV